jgi:hypothetical protein
VSNPRAATLYPLLGKGVGVGTSTVGAASGITTVPTTMSNKTTRMISSRRTRSKRVRWPTPISPDPRRQNGCDNSKQQGKAHGRDNRARW